MKGKPKIPMMPGGGGLGLPADFLVASDGSVGEVNYGAHAYDQWTVDELLGLTKRRGARIDIGI